MKLCVDCRHHQENFADLHVCDRPVIDPVTGKARPRGVKAEFERDICYRTFADRCGPDARLFEPKEP